MNTSIGIVGPPNSEFLSKSRAAVGNAKTNGFRILEGEGIATALKSMTPKETSTEVPTASTVLSGDEDVQMAE